jgi:hypothetical protein
VPWRLLADLVVLLHLAVVGFILFGGLLAWRWPRAALVHLPFAAWGVAIELGGWICPLTPLENRLRRLAGDAGYDGGFVERYVLPVLYPGDLDARGWLVLAALVLAVNAAIYLPLVWRLRRRGRARSPGPASSPRERAPPRRGDHGG